MTLLNADQRDLLGKALQEKRAEMGENWEAPWEEKSGISREHDMLCAEAVVEKYIEIIRPGLRMLMYLPSGRRVTSEELSQFLGIQQEGDLPQ